MKTAAFVLGILSTIAMCWLIIPLFWCIPMLIKVKKAMDGTDTLSTGFNVCYLLFVNLIGGVLLLCDNN